MEKKSLISFLVIILAFIHHSSAVLLNQDGVIRPRKPYVHYGEDLILWCNLTRPEIRENSSSMYFMFNDQIIPRKYIRIVNTKSIKLVYKVTPERFECSTEVKRFNFVCLLNKTSGPEVLDNELVQVNYAVKPISNFQCRVYNWESMNCSWDLSTKYCNYGDINVTLVYVVGDSRQQDCHSGTRTSCVWTENIFHPDMPYRMIVEVKNKITDVREATDVKTIQTKNIVKPAPVSNFRVSRDRTNSTCLVAVWSHMKKHRKRQYKMEIVAEYDEIPKVIYFYERDNYTFCGLQPYTLYTISVSNIPVLDGRQVTGFWSDTVETVIRTAEDIPSGVPGLSSGCYVDKICSGSICGIHLFWQPIKERLRFGLIIEYKIQITDAKSRTRSIFLTSGEKTSFPVDLPNRNEEEYYIFISGRTRKGFSHQKNTIIIPSLETAPSKVENVVVEAVRNTGTNQYLIQWSDDEQEKVYSYTLYYCKRSDKTQDCRENLSWEILDANKHEFMLELEMEDDDFTWHQIGISREEEKDGKIKSSGIVWNKCVYIKDTKPSSEPKNVRFADLQPDQALLVEWDKLDCIENKAHVTSYLIHICHILRRNGPCVGKEKNITVSNNLTKYQIENLTPASLYQVTIQAVSRAGIGPKSPPISHHVTDSSLTADEIIGFAFAIFVVIMVIITVGICIGMGNKEKKKCEKLTRIAVPELPHDYILRPYEKNVPSHQDMESFTKSNPGHNGGEDMQSLIVKVHQDKMSEESQPDLQKELEGLLDSTSKIIQSSDMCNSDFPLEESSNSAINNYTEFGVYGSTGRTCSDSQQSMPTPINTSPVVFAPGGYVPNNLFSTGQILKGDHKPFKQPYPLIKLAHEHSDKKLQTPNLNCLPSSQVLNDCEPYKNKNNCPKNNLFLDDKDQPISTHETKKLVMDTQKDYVSRNEGEKQKTDYRLLGNMNKNATENRNLSLENMENKEQNSVALSKQGSENRNETTQMDIQFQLSSEEHQAKASLKDFHMKNSCKRLSPHTISFSSGMMPSNEQKIQSKMSEATSEEDPYLEHDSVKVVNFTRDALNNENSPKKKVSDNSIQGKKKNTSSESLTCNAQTTEFTCKDDSSVLCDTETAVSRNSIDKPNVQPVRQTSDYVPVSMLMKHN